MQDQPSNPIERNSRPLLVTFHCGVFFFAFAMFSLSVGRQDVEANFNLIHPDYIRNMLILMTLNFVGYIGLWNMRKFSVILLAIGGVLLIAHGFWVSSISLVNFLPFLAALTSLPLWPMFK